MKIIEKDILPFQEKDFFSALRTKVDYARVVVLAARVLLLEYDTSKVVSNARMKLIIDKMSRLFFYKENKFFSVSFPFSVLLYEENVVEIATYKGRKVDSESISYVITILENEHFKMNPSLIDFESNELEVNGILLLEEILQFEPAYVRYDSDAVNENGKLHPLHHLDINYSAYATYKFGLRSVINESYFEDILNITTNCSFIIK